jgi:hypothetical protein
MIIIICDFKKKIPPSKITKIGKKNIVMSTTIWLLILMGLKMNVIGCKCMKQNKKIRFY